jgi:hypothetical protein
MNDEIILHGLKDAAFAIKESKQRFEEIEKIITAQSNGWFDHIDGRLNEVEEILNRITQNDITLGRKPHKCPVCFGNGDTEDYNHCFPCDGKGIVWG